MPNPRKILLPFSVIYGAIVHSRNVFYDKNLLKSTSFSTPVICVGNLSVGGTGKTPMIEYLMDLLLPSHRVATLSRGYGRKSKGFILLSGTESATIAGDEPLQFKVKYPDAIVAVDEKRKRGIEFLLAENEPEVILLDDAFQHRSVKGGLKILLSAYGSLYVDDYLLPAGNLREPRAGASRADIIVITKCPEHLSQEEQKRIKKKLKLDPGQKLFFSCIQYGDTLQGGEGPVALQDLKEKKFTLVTGIANPRPLVKYLKSQGFTFEHHKYPDHHSFRDQDLKEISKAPLVLTTEKDYMRLKDVLNHPAVYYLPIKQEFIGGGAPFRELIQNFVNEK